MSLESMAQNKAFQLFIYTLQLMKTDTLSSSYKFRSLAVETSKKNFMAGFMNEFL